MRVDEVMARDIEALQLAQSALENVKNMIAYCRMSYETKVKRRDEDAASMVEEYEYCMSEGQARVDEALAAIRAVLR